MARWTISGLAAFGALLGACAVGGGSERCSFGACADAGSDQTGDAGVASPPWDAATFGDAGGAGLDAGAPGGEGGIDAAAAGGRDAASPDGGPGSPGADSGPATDSGSSGCADGVQNGGETGVDCGGPCGPCGACAACSGDADCASPMRCLSARCRVPQRHVVVDWRLHCPSAADGARIAGLPAGRYRIDALWSAGNLWSDAAPPSRGWSYAIQCDGMSPTSVGTPPGVHYATSLDAWSAVSPRQELVSIAGGDLRCYRPDATCGDNQGAVEFLLAHTCP